MNRFPSTAQSIIEEVDSASESEEEQHTKEDTEEDKEASEKRTYENVYEYLTKGCYPQGATKAEKGATKAEKGVLRRRAKSFRVVDGILHYKACQTTDGFTPVDISGGFMPEGLSYTVIHK